MNKIRLAFLLCLAAQVVPAATAATIYAAVTVGWRDNALNETGNRIERANAASGVAGSWIAVASVGANSTAWIDRLAVAGQEYAYRVCAFNAAGDSPFSNVVFIRAQGITGTAPEAPGSVTASNRGQLVNVSARALVTVGDATAIPGFAIAGGPLRVLVRVIGPAIAAEPYRVPGASADPRFDLKNAAGETLASNDDWSGPEVAGAAATVGAFALPVGSSDAAILIELAPGAYTVVTAGASGIALCEVYKAE